MSENLDGPRTIRWLALPLVALVGAGVWIVHLSTVSTDEREGTIALVVAPEPTLVPIAESPSVPVSPSAITSLVDPAWAEQVARSAGIPARAVLAYAGASLALAIEKPDCELGWNTLAAIGYTETAHGTHDGGAVAASGVVTPPILGPLLDGTSFDEISDTDGGALDGSADWDRALGPLQFIPSTWAMWGADANGDGVADPQQIDDASLTAARYLCAAGSMRDPANWRAAVLSYNHAETYVDRVADVANYYAEAATASFGH